VTTWRRIPVTTVARTLVDIADGLPVDDLASACHEAGVRHGTTPARVEAVPAWPVLVVDEAPTEA